MAQNKKERLLWGLGLLGTAVFALLMVWLHYQQLISTGYYYSDIPAHMAGRAMGNTGFSLVTILLRFVFGIGGNLGTAVFLGAVNLLTLLIIAWAIRKVVPQVCPGGALLWSLAANLCQAVWMPNGGYWYFGAITGTIYHNTTYIMLQPLALISFFLFLSLAEHHGQLQWRRWMTLTVLLTVATAIKPSYLLPLLRLYWRC